VNWNIFICGNSVDIISLIESRAELCDEVGRTILWEPKAGICVLVNGRQRIHTLAAHLAMFRDRSEAFVPFDRHRTLLLN